MRDGARSFPPAMMCRTHPFWCETWHQCWFPEAPGWNWKSARPVGQCEAGIQLGHFMQNLSLEKKTPTLCWHWDLHVTNNLCTAKRVNAAEPKTENLKEPRAALAYGNVPFALGQCHGAKSLSTQMSFTSCPVSQLYNRLLRMITVACVVSSPKCLWVECKSMQCFKCGKYFIILNIWLHAVWVSICSTVSPIRTFCLF